MRPERGVGPDELGVVVDEGDRKVPGEKGQTAQHAHEALVSLLRERLGEAIGNKGFASLV